MGEKTTKAHIGLRLESALLARVDQYARDLAAELRIEVSRTDAVVSLLQIGLDHAPQRQPRVTKGGKAR